MKPLYPLKDVKRLLNVYHHRFDDRALVDAKYFFEWGPEEMKNCLLKLNDRFHLTDPEKNHFSKTDYRYNPPLVKMDFYKIRKGPEQNQIYIHLYIDPKDGALVIDSFKELQL